MGKSVPICAGLLLFAVAGPALATSLPPSAFSALDAALAAGNGNDAVVRADAALNLPGLDEADRARLFLDRGLGRHLQGDTEDALSDLTQAINAHSLTNPEQARAYLERGLVLDGLGRLDDAVGDYGAVWRLAPNSPVALNNRANIFRRQNRFEDARRDYLASLAADNPAAEYPYYGLGQIAEREGKADEARSFYTRAVAANPGYGLAAERLAALGGAAPAAGTITLKPPKGMVADDAPLVLHLPRAEPVAKPAAVRAPPGFSAAPTVKPAGYTGDGPGLRPALDNRAGQEVQLGAWRQESDAAEGWNRAVKSAAGMLSGYAPHIVAVDLPGRGRYYRLRVAAPDGKALCAALSAKGLDCIPAAN